ncbi:MAG: type 11 [Desulfovibrionaceae bacterium]|nr:MAG: type 11 [Desulfovibrionaceae bacterium]
MQITTEQRSQIEASIRDKYRKVASSAAGLFRYPTGQAGLDGQGYAPQWLKHLPPAVRECFCGVGNPFSMGLPAKGQAVLDVGCGCGVDTLVAAGLVGETGRAVGVEMSTDMLATARLNAQAAGAENVEFAEGSAERLPFEGASFDLLISSGVYNLVIDKQAALTEAFRVLKPGGSIQIADQMLTGPAPMSPGDAVASWFT